MNATEICNLIDSDLIEFIHKIVLVIKIGVPIVLIFLGMLDFLKGVAASKEDEIKKGQQVFIKRLIAGFLVFFTFTIVQFVIGLLPGEDGGIIDCANMILNGNGGTSYETDDGIIYDDDDSLFPSASKCSSQFFYKEYMNCIEIASDQLDPYALCNSLFQGVCTVDNSAVLWDSDDSFSENLLPNVSCHWSNGDISVELKKQVYSCATYMLNDTISLEESANRCMDNPHMSDYCHIN